MTRFCSPVQSGRTLFLTLASAGVCLSAAPAARADTAPARDPFGFVLQITDGDRLGPGGPLPDQIGSGVYAPSMQESFLHPHMTFPTVYRGGQVVAAGSPIGNGFVDLDDLHDGDVIVLRDHLVSGDPELTRFTYKRNLGLTEPICAGKTVYAGMRTDGSDPRSASSVLWVPSPTYPASNYPGPSSVPPSLTYPGGQIGWNPTQTSIDDVAPVGSDGIAYSTPRPLKAGMHVALSEYFVAAPNLTVSIQVSQQVNDCGSSTGTHDDPTSATPPAPAPKPVPTPVPTPTPAPAPSADKTRPAATLTGVSGKTLKRLGLRKLIAKGLSLTITVNEKSTLTGTVTLVQGKKTTVLKSVSVALIPGTDQVQVRWPARVRRLLAHARPGAKLRLTLVVTDTAGNQQALAPIALRLPN